MSRQERNSAPIAATRFKKMKAMRTLSHSTMILFLIAVLSLPAYSQDKGVVEGRVIDRTDPAIIVRGASLDVVGLSSGMSILKSATTDSAGKFRIEGLPTNGPLMIRANYKGANYHAQLSFNESGLAHAEIEVYEPTNSMAGILVEGIQMTFQAVGGQLVSLESISFNNKTNPPKTYVNPEGALRVSKAAGIIELPKIRVTAPGASMPIVQSALESPDGQSYYSQYPLRPGITAFEVQQILPYANRSYTFTKKFLQDANSLHIGVIPKDMVLSGPGLSKIQSDSDKNFSVYKSPPIKAGSEVVWNFSGGSLVEEPPAPQEEEEANITKAPNAIGRNALFIGSLLLAGFIAVLWYAFNHDPGAPDAAGARMRQWTGLREKMLRYVADLDRRYEIHRLNRQDYLHLREEGKRQLRRILLAQKNRKN
jgi:hypothetical protein